MTAKAFDEGRPCSLSILEVRKAAGETPALTGNTLYTPPPIVAHQTAFSELFSIAKTTQRASMLDVCSSPNVATR
jgi:hypothetical protein